MVGKKSSKKRSYVKYDKLNLEVAKALGYSTFKSWKGHEGTMRHIAKFKDGKLRYGTTGIWLIPDFARTLNGIAEISEACTREGGTLGIHFHPTEKEWRCTIYNKKADLVIGSGNELPALIAGTFVELKKGQLKVAARSKRH